MSFAIHYANTAALFAIRPRPPGQYLVLVGVGELITHSSVFISRVAVVSIDHYENKIKDRENKYNI